MSTPRSPRPTPLILGVALVATGVLPWATWLLSPGRTGPAGAAMRELSAALWPSVLIGTAIVGAAGWLGARTPLGPALADPLAARIPQPRGGARWRWSIGCGVVATIASMGVHVAILRGQPTLVDEMVQLADARVDGALDLPVDPAFRVLANGRVVGPDTDAPGELEGWVSVYPPGHTAVLAAKLAIGEPAGHLVVAGLWGGAVALSTALFFLLLAPAAAAVAGALLAASPFGWLIAAGSLSHVTAVFGVALALLGAVAATRSTGWRNVPWASATGVGTGIAVTARPLAGLALAVLLPTLLWIVSARRCTARRVGVSLLLVRSAAAVAAGLPFLVEALRAQIVRFGIPVRSGYGATFGPAHGLGWHVDPWGNRYDLLAAIGATAADLFTMGLAALETPAPLGVLIGAGAIAWAYRGTPRAGLDTPGDPLTPGALGAREGDDLLLLGGWVGAALVANVLYWHHGYHFGPRMLFETLPAWIALVPALGVRVARGGTAARGAVAAVAVVTLVGSIALGMPRRLGTATVGEAEVAAVRPPPAPSEDAIVFVHGSAARRATARLQALGVRGDSIESAIRRNDLCELAAWIDVRRGVRPGPAPEIDFAPRPGSPPRVVPVETGPGVFARVRADVDGVPVVSVACRTDVLGPDRVGTLELDPLLWAVEREGAIEGRAPLWARDLGPRDNARLIDAFSGRPAWVLVPDEEGVPRYEPYDAAMTRIWGVDVSAAGPAGRSP